MKRKENDQEAIPVSFWPQEAPEPAQRGSAQPKEPKETEPPRTFAASAKKKGKKKKGKSENEEELRPHDLWETCCSFIEPPRVS